MLTLILFQPLGKKMIIYVHYVHTGRPSKKVQTIVTLYTLSIYRSVHYALSADSKSFLGTLCTKPDIMLIIYL